MYTYRVKDIQKLSGHTHLLSLRPKGAARLRFVAGQYAAVGFKTSGRPSPMRCFSIVSSPHDTEQLQFAFRVYGDFTQALTRLQPGDELFIHGPFGNFVIDEQLDKSVILLAGGIGITPFMSMIRAASENNFRVPITLLFSCSSQDNIPFYDELVALDKQNPRFNVVFFVTNGSIDKLRGSRVLNIRIEERHISKLTAGKFNNYTYFLCGPKSFTHAIQSVLAAHDTDPERIITEEFTPSSQSNAVSSTPKFSISRWTYGLTAAAMVLGTFFIMTIDLARAVPRLVSAQTTQTPSSSTKTSGTTTTTTTPSTNDSSSATTTTSATPSTTTNTTTGSGTSTTSSSQKTSQYQPPVTSVS